MQTSSTPNIMVLSLNTREHIDDHHFQSLINFMEVQLAENIIEHPHGSETCLGIFKKLHDEVGDIINAIEKGSEFGFVKELHEVGVWALRAIYDQRVNCISVAS